MSSVSPPLPVAVLRRRSANAKSAKDLHDAAYFAWEVSVRIAVAANPPGDASPLARAALGRWVGALERSHARIQDPALLDVWRLLTQEGAGKAAPPSRATPHALLQALPAYRNRVIGHGSIRLPDYYARAGAVLQRGLDAAWSAGVFLDAHDRICRLEQPLQPDGAGKTLARDLMGEAGELVRIEGPGSALAARTDRLYLRGRAGWRRLYPWLLSLHADGRERILCLDAVGRNDVRFLDYATGVFVRGADLAGRYPDLVADLHTLCGDVSGVYRTQPEEAAEDPDDFDGFRILGKLGEGGMGVVYLARQTSLGRLAAVKMLPRALAEDERALARFQREIDALSRCEHPNVVKILTTGTARGTQYYAMEYVEGADLARVAQTLTQVRGEFDTALSTASASARAELADVFADAPAVPRRDAPTLPPGDRCRRVVGLMRDAARGLHHLHENGIVHRDVKPANIAVTEHGQRAVIMDLGLVSVSDASQSLTADQQQVVGTMRYVSPERLRGRRDQTDRRTDVYALGATMSELLTDQPFFDGDSVERLMHQILHERPALPDRSTNGIPRDVITIVTKATEKDPGLRYGTAREMADDLQAFLDARPIAARAPTPGYVLRLAVRRHKVLTAAIATCLVLLVTGVVLFVARERRARETEARLRTAAEEEFGRAEELASFMLGDLRERLVPLGRLDLLEGVARKAKAHYEGLPAERQTTATRTRRSNALDHIGLVLGDLGDVEGAMEAFKAALTIAEDVEREHAGELWAALNVMKSHQRIAMTHESFGAYADAEQVYGRALELLDALPPSQRADPESRRLRVSLLEGRGDAQLEQGKLEAAIQAYTKGLELSRRLLAEDDQDGRHAGWVAHLATSLATGLEDQGKHPEALALLEEALLHRKSVVKSSPNDYRAKRELASIHCRLAQTLAGRESAVARKHIAEAIEIEKTLAAHDPENTEWRRLLADGHEIHGSILHADGEYESTLRAYQESLKIRNVLVDANPNRTGWLRGLASLHHEIGRLHKEHGKLAPAIESYRRSLQIIEPLARGNPDATDWRYGVYVNHSGLAELLLDSGDLEGAERHFKAALVEIRGLVELVPSQNSWKTELATTLAVEGRILDRQDKTAEAAAAFHRAVEVLKPLRSEHAPVYYFRLLGYVHERAGTMLERLGRYAEAGADFAAAVDIMKQLAAKRPQFAAQVAEYEARLEAARAQEK